MTLANYRRLLGTPYYLGVIWNSLRLGLLTTLITLAISYPASFALARARGAVRSLLLATLFLPLAASVIVKAFAWTILLRSDGVVNETLMALGIIEDPIRMIFTETALVVGAVNIFLPFMILPIYAVVAQLDPRYRRSRRDARRFAARRVPARDRAADLARHHRRRRAGVLALGLGLCGADAADRRDAIRRSRPPSPRPICWRASRASAPRPASCCWRSRSSSWR